LLLLGRLGKAAGGAPSARRHRQAGLAILAEIATTG